MVFGDFDADGLTGLAILVVVLRPATAWTWCRTSRAASRRATGCRRGGRRGRGEGRSLIVTVDTGTSSGPGDRVCPGPRDRRDVTDHPSRSSFPPAGARLVNAKRPAALTRTRAGRSGHRLKFASAPPEARFVTPDAGGRRGTHPGRASWGSLRRGRRSEPSPTCSDLGENRAIAPLGLAHRARSRPVSPRCSPGTGSGGKRRRTFGPSGFCLAPRLNAAAEWGGSRAGAPPC